MGEQSIEAVVEIRHAGRDEFHLGARQTSFGMQVGHVGVGQVQSPVQRLLCRRLCRHAACMPIWRVARGSTTDVRCSRSVSLELLGCARRCRCRIMYGSVAVG